MADLTLKGADLGVGVVHAGLDPQVQVGVGHLAETSLTVDVIGLGGTDDITGDNNADLANAGNVGVEQTTLELLGGEGLGEGLAGGIDHAIGDTDSLGQNAAETDTGEDVHVVTLAGVVGAGLTGGVGEGGVGEGRSGSEEAAAVSVDNGGLEVTLGLGGGVGEGEDDGSSVPVSHLAEKLGGEDTAHGGETHQDGGLDVVNDLLEGLELSAIVVLTGEVDLVVSELVTAVSSDQTLGVDKVEASAGLILSHALTDEEVDNLLGDTDTGGASTEEDGALVLARQTGALNSVNDTTKNDGTSTLDVVVEAGVSIPVALECGEGVLEILELDNNTII